MKKIISNILILTTLCNYFLSSAELRLNFKQHNGISASVRSLILPGWGQYYNEQNKKAYIIFAATFLSAGLSYYFYSQAEQTYKKYEERGLINDTLYSDYEAQITTANIFFVLTILSWGYNVVDAYIYGEKYKKMYGLKFKNNKIVFVYKF
ncbi:MAG: DUF5683 domain-containing protein [Endomicrobiia bacterium]